MRSRETDASAFRLERKLLYPLALLLAMPLVAVAKALATTGFSGRNLVSLLLLAAVILLFLPWFSRKVVVSPRGITSSTIFSRNSLAWGEVTKVSGFIFRERSILIIEGKRRLMITDIVGNFRHLVGYVMEHASAAVIQSDVAPLLTSRGRSGRDALVLWLAVAGMAILMALKFLR